MDCMKVFPQCKIQLTYKEKDEKKFHPMVLNDISYCFFIRWLKDVIKHKVYDHCRWKGMVHYAVINTVLFHWTCKICLFSDQWRSKKKKLSELVYRGCWCTVILTDVKKYTVCKAEILYLN